MPPEPQSETRGVRGTVVRGLSLVEDVAYVGLGILLTIVAVFLLIVALKGIVTAVAGGTLSTGIVDLLDQFLLVLLVIELLYTVQVSFREHGLMAEPFLVVALIAVIRRVLVITAQIPKLPESSDIIFRHAILELSLLTLMILVLVGALILLQRKTHSAKD